MDVLITFSNYIKCSYRKLIYKYIFSVWKSGLPLSESCCRKEPVAGQQSAILATLLLLPRLTGEIVLQHHRLLPASAQIKCCSLLQKDVNGLKYFIHSLLFPPLPSRRALLEDIVPVCFTDHILHTLYEY